MPKAVMRFRAQRTGRDPDSMPQQPSLTTLVVDDYDRAITFYVGKLGFALREDTFLSSDKRWVVVAPAVARMACSWRMPLMTNSAMRSAVKVAAARSYFWRQMISRDHHAYIQRGFQFIEPAREEPYATLSVFEDIYGNRWDLIQPTSLCE